ncbi:MAG: UDP-N-acetylmuramoyl-L-alanyl-D-glutamate--2,6-diaminopimelate ligase [Candidatus Bipolaricaulota bacterium]|nr:UDP-N-acetylmuramoyl-L-alanyl-D-glutamate--2,6-diaminopimelate ligase [Candidatus Bipolaricaulota bacterium]
MPDLSELLGQEDLPRVEVRGLSWDSRRVQPGDLFFALPGSKHDGHAFAAEAVGKGAVAVVAERPLDLPVPVVRVPKARAALAQAACAFYGHPTRKLCAIGVTGTNGKTTVVHFLGQLLPACETITTVRVEEEGLSCVTTPEAPELQRIAAEALAQGKKFFAFEASSIGLAQHRVDGVHLRAAVFTSFARDHLDFHGTLEAYLEAKLRLFRMLPKGAWAVANVRAPVEAVRAAAPSARLLTYGLGRGEVRALRLAEDPTGTRLFVHSPFGGGEAFLPFHGLHNVENALAALSVALVLGLPWRGVREGLAALTLPPGRYARFRTPAGAEVVVDFAHNPEALGRMLRELRPRARRLAVVFGCPGEADRGKRALMGRLAGQWADLVVITADNPKSEDPRAIAQEVARGVVEVGGWFTVLLDRAEAIRFALAWARAGDCVLIAGKGHERRQILAQGALPFSDLAVVQALGGAALK